MARRLMSSRDVERVTHVNLDELIDVLEHRQQKTIQEIGKKCPDIQPEGMFVTGSNWTA
jgi:hypothetical protein